MWTLKPEFELCLASILGGQVKLDPQSVSEGRNDPIVKRFMENKEAMEMLTSTRRISDLTETEAHCAILIGGHGCLVDFNNNEFLNTLLHRVWFHSKGMIGAIDQAVLALATVKSQEKELLIKGRTITCSSDAEESAFKSDIPFMVEDKLREVGAVISIKGPMEENVVVDSRLITGQNWKSANCFVQKIREVSKTM